ncbi:tetratricopeptide repeat protein, partial [Dapis sp. BLCC M126]|uniref:tetratricopeptide repeat protein n=1 Tax=Dapis sp. BLCC M126 TaxID=3400189 RepID=UPI003CF8FA04
MSENGVQGDNRSAQLGGSANSSAIMTGDNNTATITITNYYYRESTTVLVESVDTADENLFCPYRGLFHFGPNDAEFFFGREVFIEELFQATQNRNFIPVLGASGSGKSSVVLAGLVPKLQNEGHWKFTHFRPSEGDDPFHALALALVPLFMPELFGDAKLKETSKIAKSLRNEVYPLSYVLTEIQHKYPTDRVLLIADQFEEIYTPSVDREIRRSFLDTLLGSFQSSPSHSQYNPVLVATMRVDFSENALSYAPFADLFRKSDVKIRSMNHDELSEVIEKPAEKLGVTFEVGLAERILDDVEDEPGNLPLLEFALTELWKQRKGKLLTHAAYQHIGKVQGALARHADQNYDKLSATEKKQARRIFIQLVHPEEGQDTRRRATKAELGEANWEFVKQLADNRLVVTSQNVANQETVEVVHEALIRNWGEFRQWMKEDRSFRVWQERLRLAMDQWEKMQRDEGALLRGKLLTEAKEKLKQRREDLSAGEQEFIQASVKLRQRGKQRIYFSLGGLGVSLLVAMGIWGWLNYTTPGQLTQIRWKLSNVSQHISDPDYQLKAAVAFAKNEKWVQALKLANQIQDSYAKVYVLSAIAEVIGKLNQVEKATPFLEKAIDSANQIQYFYSKAEALRVIAEAYGKLNQVEKAALFLEKAIDSANQIESSYSKVNTLRAIAEAYGKLNQGEKAIPLLEKALASANQIQDSYYKADALRAIAKAIGKLNQVEKAVPLLKKAIDSANQIQDSYYKADALRDIAEAYGQLNQAEKAVPLLEKALASAHQIQDSYPKANTLRAIAESYGQLNQAEKAVPLLQTAINSANQIQDSYYKADALRAIAEAIGKLNQGEQAASLLQTTIDSTNQIQDSYPKADALKAIAEAIGKLNQAEKAAPLLEKALASAHQIQDSDPKAN